MRILIKENDKLKSVRHKGRMVSEYLIYLMVDNVAVKCYNEIGENAKLDRVNDILLREFNIDNKNNINDIIDEVSYENVKFN